MVRAQRQYDRLAWSDRFNRPTEQMLRAPLPSPDASLLAHARARFGAIPLMEERITWQGVCWRWTFAYYAVDLGRLAAVIIPNPSDLQVAMPIDPLFLRAVMGRRMRRSVREGLELAAEPFDTKWGLWSIASRAMLDEIASLGREQMDFVRRSPSL